MTDAVAQPSQEYLAMSEFWTLTATLRAGTKAMREAGKTYLPQDTDEQPAAYEARINRSVLTNLYKKTADKLVGKPLKQPIVVEDSVPVEIRPLLDDIDSLGTRLDVFAKDILQQAVDDGMTHVLVEFPNSDKAAQEIGEFKNTDGTRALSLRQATKLNIRPYARHVKAQDLIGWQHEVINGRKTLTQIRIAEIGRVEGDNPYEQDTRERVRVIERDKWELFEKQKRENVGEGGKKTEWVSIETGVNTLGIIPLVTLYTNQIGFMMARPWLEDIAWLNVSHWQSDSDQRNLLHVARVPILFAKGFGDDDTQFEISIGSNSFVKAPSSADLKYVEHSGKGITAGREDLKDIEERIQFLGLEAMMKRPSGNVTATQSAIDSSEANSSLGMVSQELENTLEGVLGLFAMWMELGEDGGGSLSVFKDFGIDAADVEDVEILLKAKQGGEISQMTFLKELKRRNLLADDFNPQTEIDLLDLEGAGTATSDEPEDEAAMMEAGETPEPEHPGRNKVGDWTSEEDGHRHILEEGGNTSTAADENGVMHSHTWDELGIRSSVDAAHSHILLTRAAQTKAPAPVIPPEDDADPFAKKDDNE